MHIHRLALPTEKEIACDHDYDKQYVEITYRCPNCPSSLDVLQVYSSKDNRKSCEFHLKLRGKYYDGIPLELANLIAAGISEHDLDATLDSSIAVGQSILKLLEAQGAIRSCKRCGWWRVPLKVISFENGKSIPNPGVCSSCWVREARS